MRLSVSAGRKRVTRSNESVAPDRGQRDMPETHGSRRHRQNDLRGLSE